MMIEQLSSPKNLAILANNNSLKVPQRRRVAAKMETLQCSTVKEWNVVARYSEDPSELIDEPKTPKVITCILANPAVSRERKLALIQRYAMSTDRGFRRAATRSRLCPEEWRVAGALLD